MYSIIGANGYLGSYIKNVILEETSEDLICVDKNVPEKETESRVKWKCEDRLFGRLSQSGHGRKES